MNEIEVFSSNITHNLGLMAENAGIYDVLWRPDEMHETIPGFPTNPKARDIRDRLAAGLADLNARPEHFKTFNARNGWGLYEHFVPFVEGILKACDENPGAEVQVSR
jgi:hypothetical protein